jgi:predicted nucleic acid-binding protein
LIRICLPGKTGIPQAYHRSDFREELDALLPEGLFRRDSLPWEAGFLAGKAFTRYKRAGGEKKRMLADFLIGAHAAVNGFTLVTRDSETGRYFEIQVVNPLQSLRPAKQGKSE